MPSYWSDKEERQYKHVLESYKGNPRAKEIAARTVNAHRRPDTNRARVHRRLRDIVTRTTGKT